MSNDENRRDDEGLRELKTILGKKQVDVRNKFSPDENRSNTQTSDAKFNSTKKGGCHA